MRHAGSRVSPESCRAKPKESGVEMNSSVLLSELKNAVTNLEFNLGKQQHYKAMKWAVSAYSLAYDIYIIERDTLCLLPKERTDDQKSK